VTARELKATIAVAAQQRIVQALDPADRGPERRAPERLAALLNDGARLAAGLQRIPGAALALLELLTEIPDRPIRLEVARREVERRLGRAGCGLEAEAGLQDFSLVLHYDGGQPYLADTGLLPGPLAYRIRPLVRGLSLRTVDPAAVTITRPAADPGSVRFAAALLSGAFQRDPPRVTQDGQIFARAQEKLVKIVFPADDPPGARFGQAVAWARRQGVLAFSHGEVRVSREALAREGRRSAAALRAGVLTGTLEALPFDQRPALRGLVAQLADGFVPVALVRSALTVQLQATPSSNLGPYYYHPPTATTDQRVDREMQAFCQWPYLALGRTAAGEEVIGLPRPAPAPAPARAYVQPNLELLLPPDVDPVLAFDAARIAEVRRVEAVAQLALTERAIQQARESDLTAAEILAILERVAPGAVPDNVRITVAGWAAGPEPARLIRGAVLYCPDPAAAETLRRGGVLPTSGGRELVPGVWIVPSLGLESTRKALVTARIPVRPKTEVVELTQTIAGHADELRGADEDRLEPGPEPDPALRVRVAAARVAPAARPEPGPAPVRLLDRTPLVPEASYSTVSGTLLVDVARRRALTREPLAIEVQPADGAFARFTILVDRCVERRGTRFLEGRRQDTQEDVSVPLDRIRRMVYLDEDYAAALRVGELGDPRPVRRDAPKVGRNDPCPCGSGRKYKKCCGRGA
jgi:hypothetical protein